MKTVSMSGSLRANVGKKDAKTLRSAGLVPCVIYGGKEQVHFSTPETSFKQIVFTPDVCFVEVDLNGKKYLTILQDIQYHKVSDSILHADLFELSDDKEITLPVPVVYEGSSPGVLKGGKLVKSIRKIKVKALPKNMPETLTVDLSKLDIGDMVKIGAIEAKNFTIVDSLSTTVCAVKTTRNVVETPAEAAKK
ncbi:MAG: 50S ribosomal protein L25/general stress protein Ctc [Bacteroidales bacterium]|jgi:large subunit ribosomal protein L25|nr:50S ribosomal protein L25/general stress protein Ctc [Bacteroidales bacterium]